MKNTGRGKVLVLGNDTRSFLTVIRSLGRKGVQVHIAWCDRKAAAQYSRYVRKVHQIPHYDQQNTAWKSALIRTLDKEKFNLVIPCNDPSIIPLQLNRKELEPVATFYLLDGETFETTHDKHKMYEVARSLAIPVPNGFVVSAVRDLDMLTLPYKLPLVLKPFSSYTMDNLVQLREVRKAFTVEQLFTCVQEMTEQGLILVQENFSGVGMGVELLAKEGRILTVFQHLRVHEAVQGGQGAYRVSVEIDPELYGAAEKLVRALSYTGVAMIEFKVNPVTGRWVFLEINARFWGSLPLAVASGIDFPWYLYQMMIDDQKEFNREYRKGLFCRNLLMDIIWFKQNFKADRSNPLLHTVPIGRVALELGHLLSMRERSDTFVFDDPWPGFVEIYYWLKKKIWAFKHKAGLRLRCLGVSKTIVRRKAVRLASETKSILFVCKGNICRSPFASLYAQTLFKDDFSISSCGHSAVKGRHCPAVAQEAAKRQGVELTHHLAAPMTEKVLHEAGTIVVFDADNYIALNADSRSIMSKVVYLGTFLPGKSMIINDPDGGGLETFMGTYRNIIQAVTAFKAAIAARR